METGSLLEKTDLHGIGSASREPANCGTFIIQKSAPYANTF